MNLTLFVISVVDEGTASTSGSCKSRWKVIFLERSNGYILYLTEILIFTTIEFIQSQLCLLFKLGESTPTTTGWLEVHVDGQLIHSKKVKSQIVLCNRARNNTVQCFGCLPLAYFCHAERHGLHRFAEEAWQNRWSSERSYCQPLT